MNVIELDRKVFEPGNEIVGVTRWDKLEDCDRLDIRLIWYTSGKGDQDFGIANKIAVNGPAHAGEQAFSFPAPRHPHSFSGVLISLTWAIEVVQLPSQNAVRSDILIAPGGREIVLHRNANDAVNS